MILTPIPFARLPQALADFAATLENGAARRAFDKIAATGPARAEGLVAENHRREALTLARDFKMGILDGAPEAGFSWDGERLRADTEAYVLLHEIAHFQLAAPARRAVIDFGLGPGPDTGDRTGAERAALLTGLARESEEAQASLLGILWETALGHPALASLLDQNWLEGAGTPGAAHHFTTVLQALASGGFIDREARPTRRVRQAPGGGYSLTAPVRLET